MLRTGLSELNAFIAIAEHGSFRAAARVLGVSPSALSHTVKNLEAHLNVRLLNRTTRSVALTEAGELFLSRVVPALGDIQDAVNELVSASNSPSGVIRISTAEIGAKLLINNVLPEFLRACPNIDVEFVVDTRLVDIVSEGFDAGIRVLHDVPRDMIAIKFGEDWKFVAVASPAYLERHAPPSSPEDLMHHRCLRFRFSSGTLHLWEMVRGDTEVTLDVPGQMTFDNSNLVREAALAGIGIAWLPEYVVAESIASGELVHLLSEWSPTLPGLSLYYPANRHPPAALRLFTQAVRDWVLQRTAESTQN